jgi:lysophospholipase L1-like esterase
MKIRVFIITLMLVSGCAFMQAQNNPQGVKQVADTVRQRQRPSPEQIAAFRKAMEERLRTDWAFLSRYREDNAKIGLLGNGEDRVVFMGNSITDFWIRTMPEFFAGKSYIDRGISGQTTPQMLLRFRQDVIDLKPKVVVILAGINDINGNTGPSTLEMIEDNIKSMTELAQSNNIHVVLSSVLPCDSIYDRPDLHPAERVVQLNVWIKKYASDKGCGYIDYFPGLTNEKNGLKKEYTNDGIHPNKAGYLVMQPLAEAAIREALGQGNNPDDKKSNVRMPRFTPAQLDSMRKVADERLHKDWAYLKKYSDENKNLPAVAPGEKRVVFMGNSITEFWKFADADFFARNKSFIDRGIGGQTTPQMLVRFRDDVINLKPSVVVILAGTNDIAGNTGPTTIENIFGNIVSMAELAKANNIKVVLCSVLPVYDYSWSRGLEPTEKIVKLNAMLQSYANKNKHVYVDFHSPMADEKKGMKAEYSRDGVHPNLEGYKVMDDLVEKAISRALKIK